MTMAGDSGRAMRRGILRGSMAVAIAHLLFKLVSVVQLIVLGRYMDVQAFEAVYVFAFDGCIFTLFLLGEEVIGPTFLPIFMRERDEGGEDTAWAFANAILTVQVMFLFVAVFAIVFFPGMIVRLVTAWSPDRTPYEFSLACAGLIGLAPALICLSLGSTTYMLLNGYKRFFMAAFGDTAWKLCVLVGVLVGMAGFGMDYRAVVFGLLTGSVAKLATHLAGLVREVRRFRFSLRLRTGPVKAMLVLMLPLIAGIVFAKLRDLFNNVSVLSYLETAGLMQANFFGRKLYTTIGWLVPYPVSIAMFPFFCELVNRDDKQGFADILSQSGRMLLSVFIPFSLVCVVLARPLTFFLFYGRKFTEQSASWSAVSMSCYVLVLPAFALEYLLMQAFFAHRKMVSVTVVGVVFSTMSMAVSYIGICIFGARGVTALAVVALGFAVSRTLKTVVLTWVLKRIIPLFPVAETARFLGRVVLCGVVSAGLCLASRWGYGRWVSEGTGRLVMGGQLVACGVAALLGFLFVVRVLRIEEPGLMLRWLRERLRLRGQKRGDDA